MCRVISSWKFIIFYSVIKAERVGIAHAVKYLLTIEGAFLPFMVSVIFRKGLGTIKGRRAT